MSYALSPCKRFVTIWGQRLTLEEAAETADGHRYDAARHRERGCIRAAACHLTQAAQLEALVREGVVMRGART